MTTETFRLRAPICAVMGHVDVGKTSLIDAITKAAGNPIEVAAAEAGGITQSIGATFLPIEQLQAATIAFRSEKKGKFSTAKAHEQMPGILLLDTPGHEAFGNFRERGAVLCDLAIVVIDIEEGLQAQTHDTLKLLQEHKVPFVVVLSKLDKVYGWSSRNTCDLKKSYKAQSKPAQQGLEGYMKGVRDELKAEYRIKSEFYLTNKKPESTFSIVPVNSLEMEGIADLLALMVFTATNLMDKKLKFSEDKLRGAVMETRFQPHLGWHIDVILRNGILRPGMELNLVTTQGHITTSIRGLQVARVVHRRQTWQRTEEVSASCLVRILAKNLEGVVAGTQLHSESEQAIKEFSNLDLDSEKSTRGVILAAPTLGALQAFNYLLHHNSASSLEIRLQHVGRIMPKDLERWATLANDDDDLCSKTICYFGDSLPDKLTEQAKLHKMTLFHNPVVYRLIEQVQEHIESKKSNNLERMIKDGKVVFPCELNIFNEKFVFNKGSSRDNELSKRALVFGVRVKRGSLKLGTPLIAYIPENKQVSLGTVISMQLDHKEVTEAKQGDKVCIKLDNVDGRIYGRHFEHTAQIVSQLNMTTLTNLTTYFKHLLDTETMQLINDIQELSTKCL